MVLVIVINTEYLPILKIVYFNQQKRDKFFSSAHSGIMVNNPSSEGDFHRGIGRCQSGKILPFGTSLVSCGSCNNQNLYGKGKRHHFNQYGKHLPDNQKIPVLGS